MSGGGGTASGQKMGTSPGWGDQPIFANWGEPPVPPRKKPWPAMHIGIRFVTCLKNEPPLIIYDYKAEMSDGTRNTFSQNSCYLLFDIL